jgi:hypothetical protein
VGRGPGEALFVRWGGSSYVNEGHIYFGRNMDAR